MRLRHPIDTRKKQVIRICIPARVSKDEKKRRSTAAQAKYVRKIASSWGLKQIEFTDIADEGISGEVKERPGIAELRAGILAGRWDLIVCEDTSRLYRHPHFCHELVALAVDNGVRVIGIGDDVDTAEEDWEERLNEAQQHHARDNKFTRRRLKRAIEDLWEIGAAVGPLVPGYLRKPTRPATDRSEAEGPFYDYVDEEFREIIYEAFKRIADGERCADVADYLTAMKVPKYGVSARQRWTVQNVRTMIHGLIYRGVEDYGVTVTKKRRADGSSRQERNEAEKIRLREMPHLQIVPDWLWYKANTAIEERRKANNPCGEEHPLFGVSRDSQTPLAGIFYCGICKAKMYCVGLSYRCKNVHCRWNDGRRQTECWNFSTANRELTHTAISKAVVSAMLDSDEKWNTILRAVELGCLSNSELVRQEGEANSKLSSVTKQLARLVKLAVSTDDPPASILEELKSHEYEKQICQAELDRVLELKGRQVKCPDREQLRQAVEATAGQLLTLDTGTKSALCRLLDGPILAVPYRLGESEQFVLRAEFTLNLVNILPNELLDALGGLIFSHSDSTSHKVSIAVDLFERPRYVKIAEQVRDLCATLKSKNVAVQQEASNPTAKRAIRFAKRMVELGLTDPYVRTIDKPAELPVRKNRKVQVVA